MQEQSVLLFVYGTLKRGLANHHQLGGAPFVGEAAMRGVDLHDLGPFPMAVAGQGTTLGELFRVDDARLIHLDRFEGVPRLYRRELLPLRDGRRAWIYLGLPHQVRHSPRLQDGCWPASSNPGHGVEAAAQRPAEEPLCSHATPGSPMLPAPPPWVVPASLACGALALVGLLTTPRASGWLALLVAWLAPLQAAAPMVARADVSLAMCQRWQRSSGLERILLGNAIGAAGYLTKVQRFAESDPQHPQLLFASADLRRACDGWR